MTTSLVKLINEAHKNERKPVKSIKFNKFFPADNSFVNVSGSFTEKDDWQINLTIQADTRNVVDFWVSDWNHKDAIAQLKTIQEAAQKTIDFVTACMAQPAKATVANASKRAKKK